MKPELIGLITMISTMIIAICAFVAFYISIVFYLDIPMYFTCFKFKNHPKILKIIEETLTDLCEAQHIKVINKSIDEINKDRAKDSFDNNAIGKYIYTLNAEHQKSVNDTLNNIRMLEVKYHMPYKDICASVNMPIDWVVDEYHLPRILLAKEYLMERGYRSYYSTFLHELGHHFAVKKLGGDHNEQDADDFALEIVKTSLPTYFQLIFWFDFTYDKKPEPKISMKVRLKAYYEFLQYLWKEKKNNFKLKT